MPISQFAAPIRNFVAFIPGTYGTSLLRTHYMGGVLRTLENDLPPEMLNGLRDGFDSNLYFFGNLVKPWQMYVILAGSGALILALYILTSWRRNRRVK